MTIEGKKTIAIITGASRGIGREIALQLSRKVAAGSAFVIVARRSDKLDELKEELCSINDSILVFPVVCDLQKEFREHEELFRPTFIAISVWSTSFDTLLMVHNAGSVGNIRCRADQLSDEKEWHDYLQTNLVSMISLNNLVMSTYTDEVVSQRYVINLTSILAIKGFPSFAQYSVGKAAREAFFRTLAIESPQLRVLSYSPGPVSTEMLDEIKRNSFDPAIRAQFNRKPGEGPNLELNRRVLTPAETVQKMFVVLERDEFESGGRFDFFDS